MGMYGGPKFKLQFFRTVRYLYSVKSVDTTAIGSERHLQKRLLAPLSPKGERGSKVVYACLAMKVHFIAEEPLFMEQIYCAMSKSY